MLAVIFALCWCFASFWNIAILASILAFLLGARSGVGCWVSWSLHAWFLSCCLFWAPSLWYCDLCVSGSSFASLPWHLCPAWPVAWYCCLSLWLILLPALRRLSCACPAVFKWLHLQRGLWLSCARAQRQKKRDWEYARTCSWPSWSCYISCHILV